MHQIVLPFTDVLTSIIECGGALAMLLAVFKFTDIFNSIIKFTSSMTILWMVNKKLKEDREWQRR